MDRTLFTPPMIETFKVCKRAYQLAYVQPSETADAKSSAVCKRFILKALGEINRGRIASVNQVQKFLGQHWPVDKIRQDDCVRAFLFAYKTLTNFVGKPYRPEGAKAVGVNLKVRARIPAESVYLEDTFDLILWHPKERRLEFVDYHLHPLKPFNEAWPTASILVKQFLADRLRTRWPYEKLSLTFCRVGTQGFTTHTINLDEALYRVHWPRLVETIEEMKAAEHSSESLTSGCLCRRCSVLSRGVSAGQVREAAPFSRTA